MPKQFWLLWTVYQANEAIAVNLSRLHNILRQVPESEDRLFLPYLGLLILCGKTLPPILAIEIDDIAQRVTGEKSPSLIGLSIVALARVLPPPQHACLQRKLDFAQLRHLFESIPVATTRAVFLRWI
jgi:hypothetical protein